MKKFIPLLVVLALAAQEEVPIATSANDPSVLVEGVANVITGESSLVAMDLVVQGAEPIVIRRFQVSSEGQADWRFGFFSKAYQKSSHTWVVTEPSGAAIDYKKEGEVQYEGKTYLKCVPKNLKIGFCNTWQEEISSRSNFKNNYILLSYQERYRHLLVFAADGTLRSYKKTSSDPEYKEGGVYRLVSEKLPNGNWKLYDYEEKHDRKLLTTIRSMNPARTKTFARATLHYEDPKQKNKHFHIEGSDGQSVDYHFALDAKGRESGPLIQVLSSQEPEMKLHYLFYTNEYADVKLPSFLHRALHQLRQPDHRCLQFDYYYKSEEYVAGQAIQMGDYHYIRRLPNGDPVEHAYSDWRRHRIKTLSSPVGKDATLLPTHSFIYETGKTSVYDAGWIRSVGLPYTL